MKQVLWQLLRSDVAIPSGSYVAYVGEVEWFAYYDKTIKGHACYRIVRGYRGKNLPRMAECYAVGGKPVYLPL